LQSLCDLKTDEAVRERVGRLPPDLEELYSELHKKLTKYPAKADRRIARNAFSWLLCAQRMLNSTEFLAAISISRTGRSTQVSKDQVLDICCNLVVFDATLDTFRFAHLSVREFLENRQEYNSTATNSLAAETCLLGLINAVHNPAVRMFLSQYGQPSERESPSSNDFGIYPTIYWAIHCQLAAAHRTEGVLKDFFLFFMSNASDPTSPCALWTGRIQERPGYYINYGLHEKLQETKAASATPVFLACSFDFPEVITDQVARGIFRADYTNSKGLTALDIAVKYGSCGVVSVLLTDKAIQITDKVIEAAAANPESGKEVMMLLLDRRGDEIKITDEVVKIAAENWSSREVMALLLDRRGDEVKITDEVVKAAAGNYRSGREVMMLLLDRRGDEVKITEKVVEAAAGNYGSGEEVMELLLDRCGDEVKITEKVLKAAAHGGQEGVLRLLNQRFAVDVSDWVPIAQLYNASKTGDEKVVQRLLSLGVDPNTKDYYGRTLLWWAASNGYASVVTLLLERDNVPLNEPDINGRTPITRGSRKRVQSSSNTASEHGWH
jgi:ankyrin repeat protein